MFKKLLSSIILFIFLFVNLHYVFGVAFYNNFYSNKHICCDNKEDTSNNNFCSVCCDNTKIQTNTSYYINKKDKKNKKTIKKYNFSKNRYIQKYIYKKYKLNKLIGNKKKSNKFLTGIIIKIE